MGNENRGAITIRDDELFEIVDEEELRAISNPKKIFEQVEHIVGWMPTTNCTAKCR